MRLQGGDEHLLPLPVGQCGDELLDDAMVPFQRYPHSMYLYKSTVYIMNGTVQRLSAARSVRAEMEAARRVLELAGGRDENALWAALAAAEAALVGEEDAQPAVYCHVVVEAVAGLERRAGGAGRTRRVFALERAVLRLAAASPRTVSARDSDRLPSTDWRVLRGAFERVMEQLDARTAKSPPGSRLDAMAAVTRLGVTLAGFWLLQDRRGNVDKATELLATAVGILQPRRDVEHLAMEPRFLLAMVALVESGDKARALELFQSAAVAMRRRDSRADDGAGLRGVFDYWFAVALLQNGVVEEAAVALKRCVRANYEPVASLTLAALLHLRELDFREAADELQRAMEIDFAQSVSMFDYAVLLGRMGNFEGQLQMLEYFCESSDLSDDASGSGKKRLRNESIAFEPASRPEAAGTTLLDDCKLHDLIPSSLSRTSSQMVHLQLALAAMENGTMRSLRVGSVDSSCLLVEVKVNGLRRSDSLRSSSRKAWAIIRPPRLRYGLGWSASRCCGCANQLVWLWQHLNRNVMSRATTSTSCCRYAFVRDALAISSLTTSPCLVSQSHYFTLALSQADAFLTRNGGANKLAPNDSSAASLALIHLYKADALLCLERVEACHVYLSRVISPLLTKLLSAKLFPAGGRKNSAVREEIAQCHAQLLNNLAVATVCQEGVDAGIALLRRAVLQYPDSVPLKFNLVLLLWRASQKEAACVIWIEARGWNLQMKTEDLPDENQVHRVAGIAAGNQQASTAERVTLISEHVNDSHGDCGVSEQQLVYLDALVLDHWRKVRNAKAVEVSLSYVQFLETLEKSPA